MLDARKEVRVKLEGEVAGAKAEASAEAGKRRKVEREADEAKQRLECDVCFANKKSVVFVPCMHLSTCGECAEKVEECPSCREPIQDRLRTYMT